MHHKTVIDFKELGKRLIFTNPLTELRASQLSEVKPLIEQVEAYQKKGYYVVGYISYEASPAFEPYAKVNSERLTSEELAYFTVHNQVEMCDFPLTYEDVELPKVWQESVSEKAYQEAIEQIHHHIRQGDTYQVNYTMQLSAPLDLDSFAVYNRLVVEQGASYNAYIAHDGFAVVSVSPELFFDKKGQLLKTRPMKGTTSRGLSLADDQEKATWLAQDSKNRSENLMIVDLLRNDMGRISETDSVKVSKLCQLEAYSTVWQMTSTIESRLSPETSLSDIMTALFPCGSITGAPKIETMAIIECLEKKPRGVYCGTVGICLPNGDMLFNVAIRTLQIASGSAFYGVGGGITWDSQWQSEYEETKQKSAILHRKKNLFDLVTTGKVTHRELDFKDQHLKRLEEAATYFSYPFDKEACCIRLEQTLDGLELDETYRCRLSLSKSGELDISLDKLDDLAESMLSAVVVERELEETPHLYFKTTHRPHIPKAPYEQLFVTKDGDLAETSIANLILDIDGQWYTPPVSVGLLAGIYRQHLLDNGKVIEKRLTLDDLERARAVYACNSVRGLYPLRI
ncbi:aminodeoxychorismate synthase component I [Streptococcus sp. zg-JUN1979]|uniref:aminodeoxychorismate synthase component I n=1 Tax=Streptococcus sp. zg-JUN1979 TaxID=3391450 RepID=UPI0039A58263